MRDDTALCQQLYKCEDVLVRYHDKHAGQGLTPLDCGLTILLVYPLSLAISLLLAQLLVDAVCAVVSSFCSLVTQG